MSEEKVSASAEQTKAGAAEVSDRESQAREQGWKPKEEFHGKSDSWVDADTYVKRGEDPAYWRGELRKLKLATSSTKQELAAELAKQETVFKDRLERMGKASARALELQRTRIYEDFEAKKIAAVEDGDTAKYKAIQKEESAARSKFAEEDAEIAEPVTKKAAATNDDPDGLIADWWADNPEYALDAHKQKYVVMLYGRAEEKGHKTIADRLKYIDATLAKANGKSAAVADTEEDDKPARMPSVEGGARTSAGPRKKGWSDIPAEERAIYAKHIKEKLYKDQAEAAAAHWDQ